MAWIPAILTLLLLLPSHPSRADWFFLPTGKQALKHPPVPPWEDDATAERWHAASFPHAEFDRLQPQRGVHGWYAHRFSVPPLSADRELLLHPGVIDDADVAWVNGCEVGRTGRFESVGGSGWNRDREYRVPAGLLKPEGGVNHILIHVKDFWGLGGMMGPPVLGLRLVGPKARWRFTPLPSTDGTRTAPEVPSSIPLRIPDPGWRGRLSATQPMGCWRTVFSLSRLEAMALTEPGRPGPVLDLGPIFDAAEVRVNGRPLGRPGRFPTGGRPAFVRSGARLRCFLPPDCLRADRNELAITVFAGPEGGGLPGCPALLLEPPRTAGVGGLPEPPPPSRFVPPVRAPELWPHRLPRRAPCAEEILAGVDVSVQSGLEGQAAEVLLGLDEEAEEPATQARILSARVHLHWLLAERALPQDRETASLHRREALTTFRRLFAEHWTESASEEAVQAMAYIVARAVTDPLLSAELPRLLPGFGQCARYVGADRRTRGDWDLRYGRRAYVLAAMAQVSDWMGGKAPLRVDTAIPGDRDRPRCWLTPAGRGTADPRALLMPGPWRRALAERDPRSLAEDLQPATAGRELRRAAWWDDHGEARAFDGMGPDLLLNLDVPEGEHLLSVYLLDFDWHRTLHPRRQSVLLFDQDRRLLACAWTGRCGQGVYERFRVRGPRRLTARILKHRSACTAVAGVFLDPPNRAYELSLPEPVRIGDVEALRERLATVSDPTTLSGALVALAVEDAPSAMVFAAAARFFHVSAGLDPERLRPLLIDILQRVQARRLYPVRRWALRAWREADLPDTPLIARTERMIQ